MDHRSRRPGATLHPWHVGNHLRRHRRVPTKPAKAFRPRRVVRHIVARNHPGAGNRILTQFHACKENIGTERTSTGIWSTVAPGERRYAPMLPSQPRSGAKNVAQGASPGFASARTRLRRSERNGLIVISITRKSFPAFVIIRARSPLK